MKISSIRTVLLSNDYAGQAHLVWVGGYIDTWDAALIEVRTDEGAIGVGEVAQSIMAATAVPGIVDALAPYILGATVDDPDRVADDLRDRTVFWARGGIPSGVIGAIAIALWDAKGKLAGRPVYELLGGRVHDTLELYASGGLGTTLDEVLAWVGEQEEHGFKTVKFRAMRTPDETINLVHDVASHLRLGTQFVLDAVQGCARRPWAPEDAVRVGQVVAEHRGRWFEEPCRAEDLDGYAQVRRRVDAPISGVESYASHHDFARLVEHDAVDIVQPDVSMIGGPIEVQRVSALAEERSLGCVPHTWGTGVTLMANLHVAFATRNMPLLEWCTLPNPLREAVLVAPPTVRDGQVSPPTQPGLGVHLTPEVEARFPFKPGRGHVIT